MADNRPNHRPPDDENLVTDSIKDNWSITDPLIGANPAITTVPSPAPDPGRQLCR